MPITRTRSQSTSASHSPTLFSGFQNWRRRRPSNSLPSSPLVPSTSSNTNTNNNSGNNNDNNSNSNNTNNNATLTSSVNLMRSTSISEISYQSNQNIYQPLQRQTSTNNNSNNSNNSNNNNNSNSSTNTNTNINNNNSTESNTNNVHIRLVPNVNMSSRCFIFDIIDRDLNPSTVLKIGRYSERNVMLDRISFKSKVVSRTHAELWVDENNKLFIKDVGSSSGTFINRVRLSPSNVESLPHEVKDGDFIQLGVDYQGGLEPMYRSVKIRLELNRQTSHSYSRQAFQQLRQHIMGPNIVPLSSSAGSISNTPPLHHHNHSIISSEHSTPHIRTTNDTSIITEELGLTREDTKYGEEKEESSLSNTLQQKLAMAVSSGAVSEQPHLLTHDIQECCICLYAIAPFQALFVSPCSHIFHFKCLRPLLTQNYPAFSCPICRSYFDLEASVAIEVSEVEEALGLVTSSSTSSSTQPAIKKPPSSNIPATITEDRISEDSASSASSSSSSSDAVEAEVAGARTTSSSSSQPIESKTKIIHTQNTSTTIAQSSSNQLMTANDNNNDNDNVQQQRQQNDHINIPNLSSTGIMDNSLLSSTLVEHGNIQDN